MKGRDLCEVNRNYSQSGRIGQNRSSDRAAAESGYCGAGRVGDLYGRGSDHLTEV